MLRLELLQRLKSIPLLILMDNAFICTTMHTNWGQRITWNRINRNSTMTWKCSSTAWRVLISFSSQILACYIHLLRSQLALVEHRLSQPCLPQLSPLTPWSVPRVSSEFASERNWWRACDAARESKGRLQPSSCIHMPPPPSTPESMHSAFWGMSSQKLPDAREKLVECEFFPIVHNLHIEGPEGQWPTPGYLKKQIV